MFLSIFLSININSEAYIIEKGMSFAGQINRSHSSLSVVDDDDNNKVKVDKPKSVVSDEKFKSVFGTP